MEARTPRGNLGNVGHEPKYVIRYGSRAMRPFAVSAVAVIMLLLFQGCSNATIARADQWRGNGVGNVGKVQAAPSPGAPSSGQKIPVTVPIRTSGYETLECFIAALPT